MMSTGPIVEQVIVGSAWLSLLILFTLQLLVERKSKFDSTQLNANHRFSMTGGSGSLSRSNSNANFNASSTGATGANGTSAATSASKGSTHPSHAPVDVHQRTNSARRRARSSPRKILHVGTLQYWFHRLGFLTALLAVVSYVDRFGVNGIYSETALSFFEYNMTSFILTSCAIAFFFPIRLVRSVALLPVGPIYDFVIAFTGISTFVVANIASGLCYYADNAYWTEGIYFLLLLLLGASLIIVFDYHMFLLHRSMRQLVSASGASTWEPHTLEVVVTSESAVSVPERRPLDEEAADSAAHSSPSPAPPPTAATIAADSAANDAAHVTQEARASIQTERNGSGASNRSHFPPSTQLRRTLRSMTIFQIVTNIVGWPVCVFLAILWYDDLVATPYSKFVPPASNSLPVSTIVFELGQLLLAAVMFWYSYMDIDTLCSKDDDME